MSGAEVDVKFGAIRLVVWDLDETFWKGTLTEGGIEEYLGDRHDLVIRLAERGIPSSICSKNDHEAIKQILTEKKLWDYFVFPSIDWTPKGPRLARLVELVKLRPETVLFIDDNPGNRAEALRSSPEMRVIDPEEIAGLAREVDSIGKDDRELSRLAQYKLLETKHADEAATGDDNLAFLRSSGIQVYFEYDVLPHLPRVVELINRTNQLNFTKIRLSESSEEAIADIKTKLDSLWVQAMLVRVTDKYGDYGHVGFVLRWIADAGGPGTIEHFCFSCRTLGMDVEKWVYNKIGRPNISIVGPVISDLLEEKDIDWISYTTTREPSITTTASIPEIRLAGSCEIDALSQYFVPWTQRCVVKTSETRAPLFARKDVTTHLLLPTTLWENPGWVEFMNVCGYRRSDFDFNFFDPAEKGTVLIYSPWGDILHGRFRHTATGAILSLSYRSFPARLDHISAAAFEQAAEADQLNAEQRDAVKRAIAAVTAEAEFVGLPTLEEWETDLRRLISRFPENATGVLLTVPHSPDIEVNARQLNKIIRKVAHEGGLHVFDITDYLSNPAEQITWNHFQRIVYHRLAKAIMDTLTG